MLADEPYVRLIAFDFSKAFDSLRLSTLFSKIAQLPLPDNIYNWMVNFFTQRSHSTQFRGVLSSVLRINCSIVQGSVTGPVAYAISSSDLHPVCPQNKMTKFADDAYILVPASSNHTVDNEVRNISDWAECNNLKLNRSKSREMILSLKKKACGNGVIPPINDIERVEKLKILGVTLQADLKMDSHIASLTAKASQTLYALRVVRAHGLGGQALNTVCRAHLESRFCYAIPAWRGFLMQDQETKLQAVLNRAKRWGLTGGVDLPTITEMADKADKVLFKSVCQNNAHVLYRLLPPKRPHQHNLRKRTHSFQLQPASSLQRRNYISRMLYHDAY